MRILLAIIDPVSKLHEKRKIRLIVNLQSEVLERKFKKLMNEEKHEEAFKFAKEKAEVEYFLQPGLSHNIEMPEYILVEELIMVKRQEPSLI